MALKRCQPQMSQNQQFYAVAQKIYVNTDLVLDIPIVQIWTKLDILNFKQIITVLVIFFAIENYQSYFVLT